jgi:putative Mg2+ transporter-C (MgtC) family protein
VGQSSEAAVDAQLLETGLRLGAAAGVGIIVGINRDLLNKPIGARTLGLVALGAAIVSLAGVEFRDMAAHPDALSRVVQGIIQGIMAGISFIGAGVVLRDPQAHRVEGLTTAATVWVTAALGIACAFAAWRIVAVGLAFALILLVVVGWLEGLTWRQAPNNRPRQE